MSEPEEFNGLGRSELVFQLQRHRELRKQAESQCVRAQQECEEYRIIAQSEKVARRAAVRHLRAALKMPDSVPVGTYVDGLYAAQKWLEDNDTDPGRDDDPIDRKVGL